MKTQENQIEQSDSHKNQINKLYFEGSVPQRNHSFSQKFLENKQIQNNYNINQPIINENVIRNKDSKLVQKLRDSNWSLDLNVQHQSCQDLPIKQLESESEAKHDRSTDQFQVNRLEKRNYSRIISTVLKKKKTKIESDFMERFRDKQTFMDKDGHLGVVQNSQQPIVKMRQQNEHNLQEKYPFKRDNVIYRNTQLSNPKGQINQNDFQASQQIQNPNQLILITQNNTPMKFMQQYPYQEQELDDKKSSSSKIVKFQKNVDFKLPQIKTEMKIQNSKSDHNILNPYDNKYIHQQNLNNLNSYIKTKFQDFDYFQNSQEQEQNQSSLASKINLKYQKHNKQNIIHQPQIQKEQLKKIEQIQKSINNFKQMKSEQKMKQKYSQESGQSVERASSLKFENINRGGVKIDNTPKGTNKNQKIKVDRMPSQFISQRQLNGSINQDFLQIKELNGMQNNFFSSRNNMINERYENHKVKDDPYFIQIPSAVKSVDYSFQNMLKKI